MVDGVLKPALDQARAEFVYIPQTGHLFRAGSITRAGYVNDKGYWIVKFRGRHIRQHRLAWALHYGEWPDREIDHINGDRSDNRIGNLREATSQQNHQNSRLRPDNSTGFTGVTWHERHGKYRARIGVNGRRLELGEFTTAEEAHAAYVAARVKHFTFQPEQRLAA